MHEYGYQPIKILCSIERLIQMITRFPFKIMRKCLDMMETRNAMLHAQLQQAIAAATISNGGVPPSPAIRKCFP